MVGVPKEPPVHDDQFRAWIREQPCVLANRVPCTCGGFQRVETRHLASECAHVRSRGAGGGDPANILPLCRHHHREAHRIGHKSFAARHGLDLKALARQYWETYQAEGVFDCWS